jgi:hypothetical protein
MKSKDGKSQREEKSRRKKSKREKIREEKESKEEETLSGGSKNRLAKAAGAGPSGEMRSEKLRAVVARSAFRSQNKQNRPGSGHFWKLRC